MPKLYVIDAALRDGLLEYLSTRPYREVASAMQLLGGLMEFVPSDEPSAEKSLKSASHE